MNSNVLADVGKMVCPCGQPMSLYVIKSRTGEVCWCIGHQGCDQSPGIYSPNMVSCFDLFARSLHEYGRMQSGYELEHDELKQEKDGNIHINRSPQVYLNIMEDKRAVEIGGVFYKVNNKSYSIGPFYFCSRACREKFEAWCISNVDGYIECWPTYNPDLDGKHGYACELHGCENK